MTLTLQGCCSTQRLVVHCLIYMQTDSEAACKPTASIINGLSETASSETESSIIETVIVWDGICLRGRNNYLTRVISCDFFLLSIQKVIVYSEYSNSRIKMLYSLSILAEQSSSANKYATPFLEYCSQFFNSRCLFHFVEQIQLFRQ